MVKTIFKNIRFETQSSITSLNKILRHRRIRLLANRKMMYCFTIQLRLKLNVLVLKSVVFLRRYFYNVVKELPIMILEHGEASRIEVGI